ncbi:MAG TPA: aminotransferase class IV [Acidobacteriota bacterium]|nr:aminotransferase class IV [Acidobacteriota bacterium]
MAEALAYLNGALIESHRVHIERTDAGFMVGDGLFETLRVDCRQPLDAEAHLDRLFDGLARIRLPIPESRDEVGAAIDAVAAGAPQLAARLRVTVTRGSPELGPTRLVTVTSYSPPDTDAYDAGVAVVVVPELSVDEKDPLRRVKSISWQRQSMALATAAEQGAFEGILLNRRGRVAEGTRSNVIARMGDSIVTPPLDEGCLPGTVRRRLLEAGLVVEGRLEEADLTDADELTLANSLIGVLPVRMVGCQQRAVGGLAARLRGALAAFGWASVE